MPRTKKTPESEEVIQNKEAAQTADASEQQAPKRRGRKPKAAEESGAAEVAEAPKKASKPLPDIFEIARQQQQQQSFEPAYESSFEPSYEAPRSEPVDAIEAAERRQAKELGLDQGNGELQAQAPAATNTENASAEGAPNATPNAQQNGNPQNQENGQQQKQNNGYNNNNNRFNNNGRFNNNNKFNKFNKFKNRRNNFLPQDDIMDDSIALPPPDPEKVAASRAKWKELRGLPMFELQSKAEELGIVDFKKMRKQALVYSILSAISGEDCPIYTEGVLEIIPEGGHGFLRNPEHNYLAGPDDIYISKNIIRRYELKMGDTITGQVRQPREGEKYFALLRIDTVNYEAPEKTKRRVSFEYLTPIHPIERLNLEFDPQEYSTRLMNLFTPIGKGQRSIVLAPPRTGKTVLLQNVTKAITANHPEVKLIVLLIDERPEEVTEMRKLIDRLKEEGATRGKNIQAEVLASTFDEEPGRHIKVASLVLEKAKRLVEHGNDVVILLDSITRFARANNVAIPHSGKILSGGVDANAMQLPKKFFGAARKIENGGSLTIVGTALIETGSRMDEVIFEEFKGTGNMELVLDRRIAEKRIWPAIDIFKSGTRKEELLLTEDEMHRVWILRRYLQDMTTVEIMEFMRDKLKLFKTNFDFLNSMNG